MTILAIKRKFDPLMSLTINIGLSKYSFISLKFDWSNGFSSNYTLTPFYLIWSICWFPFASSFSITISLFSIGIVFIIVLNQSVTCPYHWSHYWLFRWDQWCIIFYPFLYISRLPQQRHRYILYRCS